MIIKSIEYLAEQNEINSSNLWKKRIKKMNKKDEDVNLMLFCVNELIDNFAKAFGIKPQEY